MVFPRYFPAGLGTELGGAQFGNPRCLHQTVKPHSVVSPHHSLPKKLFITGGQKSPLPQDHKAEPVSLPLVSLAAWVGKMPKGW